LRLKKLIDILGNEWDILPLTSGGCVFCDNCTYPAPCLKPDLRMNSLSAFGIDAGKLCEKAGLEYSFRSDRVYFVALVLMTYMGDEYA
jgi:predicted metal-binding protein